MNRRAGDVKFRGKTGGFIVDFMPYERAPLEGGDDRKRVMVAISIGTGMLVGALVLANIIPVSRMGSLGHEGMRGPSMERASKPAANGSDVGGQSESEPPKHAAATH
jgi:hypothetical protein